MMNMMNARTSGVLFRLPIALLLALVLSVPTLLAQGDDEEPEEFDDFDFSEIPVDDYRDLDYVGIGLGYFGTHTLLDNDGINEIATAMDMPEVSPGLTSVVGGGFFVGGLGFKNVRYGFYSTSGSKEVTSEVMLADDPTSPATLTPYTRKLVYSSGLLAFQLDYALFLPPDGLVFFPGLMIARESSDVELFQTQNNGLSYNTIFNPDDYNGTGSTEAIGHNRYSRIERQSFQLRPTLTLDYAVNQFVVVRAGAGYGFNLGDADAWEQSSGTPIADVPTITSDGFSLHFGLFFGLFQK